MNNERRKTLANAHKKLEEAERLINWVADQEEEALLNIPHGIGFTHQTRQPAVMSGNRMRELGEVLAQLKPLMDRIKDISEGK